MLEKIEKWAISREREEKGKWFKKEDFLYLFLTPGEFIPILQKPTATLLGFSERTHRHIRKT